MSTNRVLYVFAVVVAVFAAWIWSSVPEAYSYARPFMDVSDCTFACNSRTVMEFWDVVVLATFFTLAAMCLAAMAAARGHWDRDEVLSFTRR